jgi:hypothetical protein
MDRLGTFDSGKKTKRYIRLLPLSRQRERNSLVGLKIPGGGD